jgi:hypothetical protein
VDEITRFHRVAPSLPRTPDVGGTAGRQGRRTATRDERWGEAAGHRVSPSRATRSLLRQLLCVILSATVGVAACAGPRAHPGIPQVVSESDQVACAEFAHQRAKQMRREDARASRSHRTGNDVAWVILIVAASPVLVTIFVAALPLESWKWFANPNPDTWQLV